MCLIFVRETQVSVITFNHCQPPLAHFLKMLFNGTEESIKVKKISTKIGCFDVVGACWFVVVFI